MMGGDSMNFLRSIGAAAAIAALLFAAAPPRPAAARDDVPAQVAARTNPSAALSDRDVRYFTRQFKGKCARCHGPDGGGGGEEAAEQAVPPTDFTDAAYMATRSDGQLFYQILMGGGDRCAMPAFGPDSAHGWNEEKIWRMVAFVRRFAETPAD
jgi:mono/diheme cytochrome c family protein